MLKRLAVCGAFTTTGWDLCAEHQRLFDEGFVALAGCDPERRGSLSDRLKPERAYRTDRLAHLKRDVFNVRLAAGQVCVFIEPGIIEGIQAMVLPSPGRSPR